VSSALLVFPVVLLFAAGIAAGRDEEGNLYPSACYLLFPTVGAVSHGHDHIKQGIGDGCSLDSCWKEFEGPEGIKQCAYGRGSELDLAIKGSPKAAKQFVAGEIARSRMKKLKNKAYDLAGLLSNAKEGIVVMAVGTNIARLSLGAASDSDPSPTWPGARKEVGEDAQLIAFQLRTPGCPEDLAKCH
jgi:hypothetical protein